MNQHQLKQILDYNPDTGVFTWKISLSKNVPIGQIAGYRRPDGYIQVGILGKSWLAHRLAWLWVYGEFPSLDVDHIDGDPSNNKIENLRVVPHINNQQNQRRASKNNKSGFLGVSKDKYSFRAKICVNKKIVCLGSFKTPEEAHEVYIKTKLKVHPGYVEQKS